jgi:hypothetical protein
LSESNGQQQWTSDPSRNLLRKYQILFLICISVCAVMLLNAFHAAAQQAPMARGSVVNLKQVLLLSALLSMSVLYMQHAESVHVCCRGKAKGALPQDSVQALDVALKNGASNHPDCVTLPRAFFFYDPEVVKPVGGGAEVCLLHPCFLDLSSISINVALGPLSVIPPSKPAGVLLLVVAVVAARSGIARVHHTSKFAPSIAGVLFTINIASGSSHLPNWASSLYMQSWA